MNPISFLLYFLIGCCLVAFGLSWWQVIVVAIMMGLVGVIEKEGK